MFAPFRELGLEATNEVVGADLVCCAPFLILSFLMMSLMRMNCDSLVVISFTSSPKSRCTWLRLPWTFS